MTYEEIVFKVRESFENADAREIFEHVAVQVNIEGEGAGAFYIEVAERYISVEPYDYHDRDGLLTASGETLIAIAEQRITLNEAVESGAMKAEGNPDKLRMLSKIKFKSDEAEEESAASLEKMSELADELDLAAEDGIAGNLGEEAQQIVLAFTETNDMMLALDATAEALEQAIVGETEKVNKTAAKAKTGTKKATEKKPAAKKTTAKKAEAKPEEKSAKTTAKKTTKKAEVKPEEKKAVEEKPAAEAPKKTIKKKTMKADLNK